MTTTTTAIFATGALGNRSNRPLSKEARQFGMRPLQNHETAQIETLIARWKRGANQSNWALEVGAYVDSIKIARRELALRSR